MTRAGYKEVLRSAVAAVILVPLVVLLLPVVVPIGIWMRLREDHLRRAFARKWIPCGRVGLLVYSNSPHWKSYVETHWLPELGAHLVLLNWSERARWVATDLEPQFFHAHATDREYNPMAIILTPERPGRLEALRRLDLVRAVFGPPRVTTVRFWQAFRDCRHGRDRALRRAETALRDAVHAARSAHGGV